MLEQEEADYLLRVDKVYSNTKIVDLSPGSSTEYQLEDYDGIEYFFLDVSYSARNANKFRLQLRARRSTVLARLCTAKPHTNPDGIKVYSPHLHRYREGYEDRWAEPVTPFEGPADALEYFCENINLPIPDMQGGLS